MGTKELSLAHFLAIDSFYSQVKQELRQAQSGELALVSLDFDNFNFVNDLFCYEIGDLVLERIEEHFSHHLQEGEWFSRIHADHFVFLVRDNRGPAPLERFRSMMRSHNYLEGVLPEHYHLVCSGGIVQITQTQESLPALLDKANFARKRAKGSHVDTFLIFDQRMNEEVEWKKVITLMMESALRDQEFEMYLQPKVLMKSGEITGAEALVRWNSKNYGLIYPDRFIPILEQNGFIRQMDFFMLEQACRFLRHCMEEGLPVLPISVNFSKIHMRTPNFVDKVYRLVEKFQIPTWMIEIELTENILSEDFHCLVNTTGALKYLGFRVSLDDFGSAYSSLNYLKELPLDIIKIDKGFLRDSTDTARGRTVLSKIIEMIKSLRLLSVMEGVETEEQSKFLQGLSCDLGQGYFYAKPMPVEDYERFLQSGRPIGLDSQGHAVETSVSENPPSRGELGDEWNRLRGLAGLTELIPGGVHQCKNDRWFTLVAMGESFLRLFGYSRDEICTRFQNRYLNMIHPDDREAVCNQAKKQLSKGNALELEYRVICKDGTVMWLLAQGLRDGGGQYIYCVLMDNSRHRQEQESLRLSLERHKVIMDQATDIIFEWDLLKDTLDFSRNWRKKFGYQPVKSRVREVLPTSGNIYGEDLPAFLKLMEDSARGVPYSEAEFRIKNRANLFTWCRVRATVQYSRDHRPIKVVGVISDIDVEKKHTQRLMDLANRDALTGLYNKAAIQTLVEDQIRQEGTAPYQLLLIIDLDDFKSVNDIYGHLCGDSLLCNVAGVLIDQFRASDLVGRVGGDEFLIFLPEIPDRAVAEEKARSVLEALLQLCPAPGAPTISCSVGGAFFRRRSGDFFAMYQCADQALYYVKGAGKRSFAFYDPALCRDAIPCGLARSAIGSTIRSEEEKGVLHHGQGAF